MLKSHVTPFAAILLLAGCATAGNDAIKGATLESVSAQLIRGQTTKDQVRAKYGQPTSITLNDAGSEQWTYDYARMSATPANFIPIVSMVANQTNVDKTTMVVLFDTSGIVKNFTVSQSQSQVRRGLSAAINSGSKP